jgi:hypothetical protein
MPINQKHLKEIIIKPVLKHFGMWSQAAENLLLGTAAHESHLGTYLMQNNNAGDPVGPALGLFGMEKITHDDIWDNVIRYRKSNYSIHGLEHEIFFHFQYDPECGRPLADNLVNNLQYAALMCRLHYSRFSEPLPRYDDIRKLAAYWKKYYNTEKGKGTIDKFIRDYERYIGEES